MLLDALTELLCHCLAMIAVMRLGLPHLACHMHAPVLKHMKYFIKTAHGISDAYYRVI
jgi:hypothetical protein